ncbi:hypothetical protein BEL04_14640 [Mucilaginibacter sp. PPCGB 2223]|uniref:hypothetical protein n=1 Tax=Mucilaginibacter sp. PPCGB 2223 TaxID=1886027 RepID=UPI0008257D41|nr:hypothetical protein [Mucilaginibacter sp. PPCGB 2223]OCX52681.1 hypothetical protein BEL04_14640 [Mucilaginibacter sp. PPCGB 2223]
MIGNNLSYSLKVCLTSAVLSPGIIIVIDTQLLNARYRDVWQSLQMDLLISLALTIPIWLCFYFITRYVNASPQFFASKKFILGVTGTFLAFSPVIFWLFYNVSYFLGFNVIDLVQPLTHALFIVIAIIAFKLKPNLENDRVYGDYNAG